MRALLVDHEAQARIKRVLDFATKPENYYRPFDKRDTAIIPPGDDKRHCVDIRDGFRCVFSITVGSDGKELSRHLSISVDGPGYPHPFPAFTIATLFGFTGWTGNTMAPPWPFQVNELEHCIVMAQEYKPQ